MLQPLNISQMFLNQIALFTNNVTTIVPNRKVFHSNAEYFRTETIFPRSTASIQNLEASSERSATLTVDSYTNRDDKLSFFPSTLHASNES
mmetsp:Transcript_26810/g.55156  ORF Transcript_26810/g.55156 Transcript_26810/m.55156 type:complete len:91 (+) Transcript_26810:3-275(+)